jgi:hypothetical protein
LALDGVTVSGAAGVSVDAVGSLQLADLTLSGSIDVSSVGAFMLIMGD